MSDFNFIYQELGTSLRNFIFSQIGNKSDAEDVVQDVFLKIHTKLSTLRDSSKITSWVYQIARNTIIDFIRAGKEFEVDTEIPDYSYIEKESDTMLQAGLEIIANTLPETYRETIILKNFQQLSNREISLKLNISEAALKSRLYRSRVEFKKRILEFCHFEFDRYGTVIDYKPKECFICHLKKMKIKKN